MSFGDFVNGFYDVYNQLPEYLKNKAIGYFAKEQEIKDNIKTLQDFEKRRDSMRKYFIDAIGGLDIERTPLNPVCTGTLEREGYIIRKIIFQSQPQFYVTCNLYIPAGLTGKAPAILFACGHSEVAKAGISYQKVCIDLAGNGFIVLAVDCISQGERCQYYDTAAGRKQIDYCVPEHCYEGLPCDLTGSNLARYFIWDLIRSLDYLCTLPEVDTGQIGMTGSSGGGTQTAYMMLADDRIKVAAPCNYITSRFEYMKTGQAHDSEQNIYGVISEGLNYDDIITCFAPRPALIGSADSDFFCIEGTVKTFERSKYIYSLFGCEENIQHHMAKGTHAFNDELRETVVNWFIRHLKGESPDFKTDTAMTVEDDKTLWCTASGQVIGTFEDARTVYDLNLEYFNKNRFKHTDDLNTLKKNITGILNMPEEKNKIYPRTISTSVFRTAQCRHIFFFSQTDIIVTGIYIEKPNGKSSKCTILLLEQGTKDMENNTILIEKLLTEGDVFLFDPRGVGVVQNRPVNFRPDNREYGTEFKLNFDAIMMKTSLCALRVYDVLRACDFLNEFYPEKKLALAGKGFGAIHALIASVFRDDIIDVYLENMLPSFEEIITQKYYKYDPRLNIYGILKYFDLPEIVRVAKNKKIILARTIDL